MATIHDVAAYIIDHFGTSVSPMKLQKLSFFSQGWALALLAKPLFREDFEAWVNGPVSYDLFDVHRGEWAVDAWPKGRASNLTERERVVVDAVLKNYGALSGKELSELTHKPGTPWHQVRAEPGLRANERTRELITRERMKSYFVEALKG